MDTRRFILRLVAGGYVLYLGIQLLQGYLNGSSDMNTTVTIGAGVLFLIFGAWSVLSAVIPIVKNGGFAEAETGDAVEIEESPEEELEEKTEEMEVEDSAAEKEYR